MTGSIQFFGWDFGELSISTNKNNWCGKKYLIVSPFFNKQNFICSKMKMYHSNRQPKNEFYKNHIQISPATIYVHVWKVKAIKSSTRTRPWICTFSFTITPRGTWRNDHISCNLNRLDIFKAYNFKIKLLTKTTQINLFNLFTCQQTRGDQSNKKKKGRLSRKEGAQKSPKKENREFLLAKGKSFSA